MQYPSRRVSGIIPAIGGAAALGLYCAMIYTWYSESSEYEVLSNVKVTDKCNGNEILADKRIFNVSSDTYAKVRVGETYTVTIPASQILENGDPNYVQFDLPKKPIVKAAPSNKPAAPAGSTP